MSPDEFLAHLDRLEQEIPVDLDDTQEFEAVTDVDAD